MTTIFSVCAIAGLLAQAAMYRWSFVRGNRRIALRILHLLSFGAFVLLLLHAYVLTA